LISRHFVYTTNIPGIINGCICMPDQLTTKQYSLLIAVGNHQFSSGMLLRFVMNQRQTGVRLIIRLPKIPNNYVVWLLH